MTLFTPEYWPPISHMAQLLASGEITLQLGGTYQKQSFLNRCGIAGVHGVLTLSVPLVGGREQKSLFSEIRIDYSQRWAVQHLRTLQSCYGKAPFFEYYYPGVEQLLLQPFERLAELNERLLHQLLKWLKWEGTITQISGFIFPEKAAPFSPPPYVQVFSDRQPFRPDLSILDLLFCVGPASVQYLQDLGQQFGC